MELPRLTPIPSQYLPLFRGEAVAAADDGGEAFSFRPAILLSPEGKTLALGLEQERTRAGRGLVRALWFGGTVTLFFPREGGTVRLPARPWKCHITGGLFRQVLDRYRAERPAGDLSVVWELHPVRWEETAERPPVPMPQELLSEAEVHLELLGPGGGGQRENRSAGYKNGKSVL